MIILQDVVLNGIRREDRVVTITTINNEHYTGTIRGFDNFTIILDDASKMQILLYKYNIVSIKVGKPILINQAINTTNEEEKKE